MVARPRLLDLFCGQGGAAMGYHRAGFDVTGVDHRPQPRYPFTFVQADALDHLVLHGHEFDAIHASPPCQAYTIATFGVPDVRRRHPRLIEPLRRWLLTTGRPYVIENVPGAPLHNPAVLCGSMFGLTAIDDDGTVLHLRRHRLFESNVFLLLPALCHHERAKPVGGVYGGGLGRRARTKQIGRGGYTPSARVRSALLGIDWMTQVGLAEAIPPAYTEWIGAQLIDALVSGGSSW